MISTKGIKISQSAAAIVALFALILMSATTITALNPILENAGANNESGKVAGISTASKKLPLNLSLNLSKNSSFNIYKTNSEIDTFGSVVVDAQKLTKGTYKEDLVKIYNPNNEVAKAKVKFYIPQDLKGKIKVYLEDSKDSLIMYTIEQSYGAKTITLPELAERKFKIRVESSEDITSQFELVFVFTVGQ